MLYYTNISQGLLLFARCDVIIKRKFLCVWMNMLLYQFLNQGYIHMLNFQTQFGVCYGSTE